MTSQQFLVCDSSTVANFKQWAQAISSFFTTAGWTQSSDTGQVNWSTISTVPGSGAYVYEVWKPGDGLTAYFLKIEYGNTGAANCPSLRITLSTTTNGAGTATGFVTGPWDTNVVAYTAPSTTTQYECDFSGDAGRMCVMMWRNGINNCQQMFAVERSLNSSGASTSSYATLYVCGLGSGTVVPNGQASLVFGIGVPPVFPNGNLVSGGWCTRGFVASTSFNGSIAMDTAAPMIGYFDYPGTVAGLGWAADLAEGVTFNVTLYGSTRTYMPSKNGPFATVANATGRTGNPGNFALLMRYD